jgi:hypothetical protein
MTARCARGPLCNPNKIYFPFSQDWLPTVQEVLHADWQEVWHSPHPPFFNVFCNLFVFNVFTCFIIKSPFLSAVKTNKSGSYSKDIIPQISQYEKLFFKLSAEIASAYNGSF